MTEFNRESLQIPVVIRGIDTVVSLSRQGDIWILEGEGVGASGATPKDAFFGALGIVGSNKAVKVLETIRRGGEKI